MNEYLRAFIIGSSWPVFVYYFYVVAQYNFAKKYSYEHYTLFAPVFLGILNMFGLFLSKYYYLTRVNRFLITGLIGATLVSIFITIFKVYDFTTTERWIQQYVGLYIIYLFVYGVVANLIDYFI